MTENYKKLLSSRDVPAAERAVLEHWDRADAFRRSVEARSADNPFVFYEGPPTANGRPGVHHVIARLCKDMICRYKTMRGHRVVRKAGWDTHGLPVEIEVENQLGIKHKDEIEAYGVAAFNRQCRESVFRYEKDWVEFTRRIGYWVDMQQPYVTCDNRYVETVWWIIKEFFKEGLVYQGHKIVPYCPRCETSLSSHEVSQGYRDVSDPSVYVKFRRTDADESFLVWTTTPWTLISNVALAVGADHEYARVRHEDETLVLASALLDSAIEGEYEVIDRFPGADLVDSTYTPLFDFFAETDGAFRVVPADFVTLDDGTGIVHMAPAFGEDDYRMHREHGIPLIQAVTPSGTFPDEITPWAGRFIKDADPDIIRYLKEEGLLYRSARIKHSYPFCWRCQTPLIYYARKSWYIRTTDFKDRMIEANRGVNWIPPEVGEFRFGNWLENNVDWSLSRERYWGTPLNLWTCEGCGAIDAVGSIAELEERATKRPDGEIDLHRPWVDGVEMQCPGCGGVMRRASEVVDVWFDSGSMPFAQYHYPWDENGMFESQFPADYISEGIDQCRGWFYSLLAISVFLKGTSPYRNCLTTELILDKHGQKMSKSRGNAVAPSDVLDEEGADAMRWYLSTTSPPWTPTRFDRDGVKETSRKMLDTLRNVYSFFAMYASIDDYRHDPERTGSPGLLDRWILSRYHSTVALVRDGMDAYDVTRVARAIQSFTLDELSNWYVRRSRRRFWKGEMGDDKRAAYHTLYTILDGLAHMLAPFTPFVADEIYLALRGGNPAEERQGRSVHLEDFPASDSACVDDALEARMAVALAVTGLGRTARNDAAVRTRQPLSCLRVHSTRRETLDAFIDHAEMKALVLDELNVKALEALDSLDGVVGLEARPLFPALGKRFGKKVPAVAAAIGGLSDDTLAALDRTGAIEVVVDGERVTLSRDEIALTVTAPDGFAVARDRGVTVVLDLAIDDALRSEGEARELINRLQNLRKSSGLDVTDRIEIRYDGAGAEGVFRMQGSLIATETLARNVEAGVAGWPDAVELELSDGPARVWIRKSG